MWRYADATSGRGSAWGRKQRSRSSRDRSARQGGRRQQAGGGGGAASSQEDRRRQRQQQTEAERAPTDERGWPRPEGGRPVVCAMLAEQDGRYPAGTYVCTWKGTGEIQFNKAARVRERYEGRMLVDVDPSKGEIEMRIEGISAEDPIRDIHVWMPGFEGAQSSFHPLFLERLKPFSVLRFYPWMRPFSSSGDWNARPRPEDCRQSDDDGVAAEYMVELCNALEAEPWFCIPHTATDEYVRELALLVKRSLHKDARVWIEYSNEVWNSSFVQAQWVRSEAQHQGVRTSEFLAQEVGRVFRGFREAFGDEASRVVRVAAGQLHNPGVARVLCRGLKGEFDAIAVGAYFGAKPDRDQVGGNDVDSLMQAARQNLDTVVMQRIAEHKKLADDLSQRLGRHISLVSYEGGQHVVARSPHGRGGGLAFSPQTTNQLQQHPEMYAAYRALIDKGQRQGLELFVAYDFVGQRTHADTFGHLRFLDEPLSSAPKFRALVEDWLEED